MPSIYNGVVQIRAIHVKGVRCWFVTMDFNYICHSPYLQPWHITIKTYFDVRQLFLFVDTSVEAHLLLPMCMTYFKISIIIYSINYRLQSVMDQ